MEFKDEISILEKEEFQKLIYTFKGKIPILFTSVHSMGQVKEDGTFKYPESYTKGVARYVSNKTGASCMIKNFDNGVDSNSSDNDIFKYELLKYVKENKIKLVIDLHGSRREREFDIELGTMNNLSADYSTINELKEAFIENGISNIEINNPFKGGKVTQYLYLSSDIDIVQIEINQRYRDESNFDNINKVCTSLINFVNYYINKTDGS